MPAERHFRAFARRAASLPASLAAGPDDPRPARLVNLGLGGALVELQVAIDPGGRVTLHVTAPNLWDPLVVPATVAWSAPAPNGATLAGLAFDHTERTAIPALVELLVAYRYE